MSGDKLLQAAKAVGLDWDLLSDGNDKFRIGGGYHLPKPISRSKIEKAILDAAEEKMLVLE
jgi:hypothetical protein